MSGLTLPRARKKQRARSETENGGISDEFNEKVDLQELRNYLQREEMALQAEAKTTLN
jgi:hypothetical protein